MVWFSHTEHFQTKPTTKLCKLTYTQINTCLIQADKTILFTYNGGVSCLATNMDLNLMVNILRRIL